MSNKISSFDRVKKAINFKYPDRAPVMHAILPGVWYKHGDKLYEIVKRYPSDISADNLRLSSKRTAAGGYGVSEEIAKKYVYEDDFGYIEPRNFMYGPDGVKGRKQDEWNCVWERLDPGIVGQIAVYPLADWENWENYRFPDPLAYWRWGKEELLGQIKESKKLKKYIIGYAGNLFEKMQWLRSYEQLMIDIAANQSRVKILADKITEYIICTIDKLAEFGIDGVMLTDDWGTQKSLMIRPELWRKIFKPYYKNIFEEIHKFGMDVHFHTDGNTIDIISDLIEVGADVINPQFSAMNLDKLGKLAKDNVCIRTDIDRQYMLVNATPKEMDEYIKKVFDLLGSEKGGIIANGELNSDCSLEAVEAMYNAFEKYGRYY